MYTHLHTHSYYSFLEGVISPSELAETAAAYNMPSIALTDHLWLSGAVEFSNACQEVAVKPIFGLEIDVHPPPDMSLFENQMSADRIVLLAASLRGWQNLCRLSSATLTDPLFPGGNTISFETLSQYAGGLICLTGGEQGLLHRYIQQGLERFAGRYLASLSDIFPASLYLSIQKIRNTQDLNITRLIGIARSVQLPLVATHPVYYLGPEQAELQRVLSAIRCNSPIESVNPGAAAPDGSTFLSPEEMYSRFADLPEAPSNTGEISDRCNVTLPTGISHFPDLNLPEGESEIETLRRKARFAARQMYPENYSEIEHRLEHELRVIDDCGYAPLFLVMEDIVQFAREKDILISSRGSAASSLIAHCLGITTPDPIRLNLYFERFLNPARVSPPDIDTDLCSRRRDEVIHYVYEKYGSDRVAMVCTINRFRHRSALREVAKAHGLSTDKISKLMNVLPNRWYGPHSGDHPEDDPYAELTSNYNSQTYQKIFEHARAIIGFPRHLSIHPGGIVIAPGPITDLIPVQLASKGVVISQFDLEPVQEMGLVKIDLLGIRGLTVLNDVARGAAGSDQRVLEFIEDIPKEDPQTSDLVENGRTIGCFQIESPGMRATLKEIQARSIDDIMVALALYRPGPLTGGLKDAFVRRHRGQETPSYPHPSMESLLQDTYGVILYQEKVLRIANELAGLNLSDADLLRRAMSHFDPGGQMETIRIKFIQGANKINNVPEEVAGRVWEMMAAFAGYGFPKAHAASYAEISWRSAWCKTHFPAYFMSAVLANWGGYYSQRVYLNEARRLGLIIKPPHVNHAQRQFSVSLDENIPTLYMGLDQVRELTRQTQRKIIQSRPFSSIQDFLSLVNPRQGEIENLIKVGAFEDLGIIPNLLRFVRTGGWQKGQLTLFPVEVTGDDWSLEQKVNAQEEILGTSLIAHPLELHKKEIDAARAITTLDAISRIGETVLIAGMRQFWRRSTTRRGETIYIMSLEDLEGMVNVMILPAVYRNNKSEFSGYGPYLVEGTVELDQERNEPFLIAEKIWRIS